LAHPVARNYIRAGGVCERVRDGISATDETVHEVNCL
jgi:hypothetical protein